MPYKNKEDAYKWHKKYREENADHINNLSRKRYAKDSRRQISATMKYKYGITYDDYDRVLAEQNECCAICKSSKPKGRGRFHIDHDHTCCPGQKTCGKCVRGLLCHNCNVKLYVIENGWAMKAIKYLEKWV